MAGAMPSSVDAIQSTLAEMGKAKGNLEHGSTASRCLHGETELRGLSLLRTLQGGGTICSRGRTWVWEVGDLSLCLSSEIGWEGDLHLWVCFLICQVPQMVEVA
jgi:hypothetical protein